MEGFQSLVRVVARLFVRSPEGPFLLRVTFFKHLDGFESLDVAVARRLFEGSPGGSPEDSPESITFHFLLRILLPETIMKSY